MKHLKIKNKVRFTISMFVIFMLFSSLISLFTSKTFSYQAPKYQEIVVSDGDTLWGLAKNLDGNIAENIYEIKKINHLEDCTIYIGQTLKIPLQ